MEETNEVLKKRIGELEFSKAGYLCEEKYIPENPSYQINVYYPNCYYGKESEFIKEGDYFLPKDEKYSSWWKVHKSCFKYPECSLAIASFDWNKKENCYDFNWIGDRPLDYLKTPELRENFFELIKFGFHSLNSVWYDEENVNL